mmetsp:Transcript_4895/g.14830  ORF Transcript_4895/g.14830 Transcript_4895/m.14830 type:complete len:185 (-) Transcript_4895:323-877(-)
MAHIFASPPSPPAPPFAPGACDVWVGHCIRAGAVLGTQFYVFLAIFVLGMVGLGWNLRNTLRAAKADEAEHESQALTSMSARGDQPVRAVPELSDGRLPSQAHRTSREAHSLNRERDSRGILQGSRVRKDRIDSTGDAAVSMAAESSRTRATGKTGKSSKTRSGHRSGHKAGSFEDRGGEIEAG